MCPLAPETVIWIQPQLDERVQPQFYKAGFSNRLITCFQRHLHQHPIFSPRHALKSPTQKETKSGDPKKPLNLPPTPRSNFCFDLLLRVKIPGTESRNLVWLSDKSIPSDLRFDCICLGKVRDRASILVEGSVRALILWYIGSAWGAYILLSIP